jgi:hypothetical protein
MASYEAHLSGFGLTEELKDKFINFETQWGAQKPSVKPYSVITVLRNDTNDLLGIQEKEAENAQLA